MRYPDLDLDRIGDSEQFKFAKEITKPWGTLDTVLAWCRSECQDEWRWQLVDMSSATVPGRYIFYFDDERDFMAFLLRWT